MPDLRHFRAAIPLLLLGRIFADDVYRKPTPEILQVLNAPSTPEAVVSPDGKATLLIERILYPPVAELAQPMLRLAGVRINPRNNGPHSAIEYRSLMLLRLDGSESGKRIDLPSDTKISAPIWSPDATRFAFLNITESAVELWIGDTVSGQIHKVSGVRVNDSISGLNLPPPVRWMADSRTLLVETVPADRGAAPVEPTIPPGPHTQEGTGKSGPVRTYEDMLHNSYDEELFDYYATSQLQMVDASAGRSVPFGHPGIFTALEPSPDGHHVLIARVHKPYSYLHPLNAFPKDVEVWDGSAQLVYKVASLPLEDRVPIEGVPTGPRNYHWIPTEAASLYWVEALDGGNPKEVAPHRDRVMIVALGASDRQPQELIQLEQRFNRIEFGESGTLSLITDYDHNKRWLRTFALNPRDPTVKPKLIWSRNMQDRYKDPGTPQMRLLPNGALAVRQSGGSIFLASVGATATGDRPFLDRYDLKTGTTQHLFRCDNSHFEIVEAILDPSGGKILTRRESPTEAPNYFVRDGANRVAAVTNFPDPTPELRKISKQLVTYKRADGAPLSFTLYLPPNYKPGTRLPTVLWAYPYEYNDTATAGQVTGSTERFTTITGPSELFFALCGYAVLDNAAMPIIGDPNTVNDTYLEQLVMDAKAAIDKATAMGVTDPNRVGVGGHSYGAFMTANLMAHSTLFKAGIARSGAYNRTLTPFGFQTERRTLWEDPDLYLKMSPFLSANKINGALLMIHGEADDNAGTFPIQSERMYEAVRGNGGTVRLVTLPYEAHGYRGLESIQHVLYESIAWFDRYVKNAEAGPQTSITTAQ